MAEHRCTCEDIVLGGAGVSSRPCGKPAKFVLSVSRQGRERLVCGVHARWYRRHNYPVRGAAEPAEEGAGGR